MTENELNKPDTINGLARDRISRTTAYSTEDVAKLLFFYRQTLIIYTWLQVKKSNGESMPVSETELMQMQDDDPRLQEIVKKM